MRSITLGMMGGERRVRSKISPNMLIMGKMSATVMVMTQNMILEGHLLVLIDRVQEIMLLI